MSLRDAHMWIPYVESIWHLPHAINQLINQSKHICLAPYVANESEAYNPDGTPCLTLVLSFTFVCNFWNILHFLEILFFWTMFGNCSGNYPGKISAEIPVGNFLTDDRSVLCALCSEGWEKLGLFEFFKAKQKAKKMKEEMSRRRSRSRSASPQHRRRSNKRRSPSRSVLSTSLLQSQHLCCVNIVNQCRKHNM